MAPVANPKTFCLDIKKTNEVLAALACVMGIAGDGMGCDEGMVPGTKADGLQERYHHPWLCVTCLRFKVTSTDDLKA